MLKSGSEGFQLKPTNSHAETKNGLENFHFLVMATGRWKASKSYHLHLFDLLNLSFNVINRWLTSNVFNANFTAQSQSSAPTEFICFKPKLWEKEQFHWILKSVTFFCWLKTRLIQGTQSQVMQFNCCTLEKQWLGCLVGPQLLSLKNRAIPEWI